MATELGGHTVSAGQRAGLVDERAESVLSEAYRLFGTGDMAAAEKSLATIWADTSAAPAQVHYLLGHIRRTQRRFQDAERYFRRAIELGGTVADYHAALADLYANAGAHERALECYAEALRLRPDSAEVLLSIARSALAMGLSEQAVEAARSAVSKSPSSKAWTLLARALGQNDRFQDGLDAIDKALLLEPENVDAQLVGANLLERAGRNDEALTALDRLEAQGQKFPATAVSRGVALSNLARLSEAEGEFAKGVARWPENLELQKALANARWMLGEREKFSRDFETAVSRSPDDIRLRLACADLLRRSDFRQRSETLLREGLTRTPGDPALLQSLGVLLDEMDRTAEGLALIQRAHALVPHSIPIRASLVCALLRLGCGDEALREIEPLRRAEPLNQEWICYETMALRQLAHPRYHELCDYERMVRPYFLSAPNGFATIEDFNEALADSLRRLHVLESHPLDQSVRGGSQTSRSLIHVDDPVIQAFLGLIDEPIRAYINAMGEPDPHHPWSGRKTGKYRLTGAWSVKLKPGGFHINHVHPAGWISGPYYVKVPRIVAEGDGHQGWVTFGEPRWPTPGCTVEKIVEPKPGLQVLFPSYMWHGTVPFSEGERMTAPLDAAPV